MKDDSEDSDVEKRFLDIPDDEDYMLQNRKGNKQYTNYNNPDSEFNKKKTMSQKKKK